MVLKESWIAVPQEVLHTQDGREWCKKYIGDIRGIIENTLEIGHVQRRHYCVQLYHEERPQRVRGLVVNERERKAVSDTGDAQKKRKCKDRKKQPLPSNVILNSFVPAHRSYRQTYAYNSPLNILPLFVWRRGRTGCAMTHRKASTRLQRQVRADRQAVRRVLFFHFGQSSEFPRLSSPQSPYLSPSLPLSRRGGPWRWTDRRRDQRLM